jgi:hypothetical protein
MKIGPASGVIDFHYVHYIVKTENWTGESYSLDIWHETLSGGPVSRLFELNSWALMWLTFLSFDVQLWNFNHVHSLWCKLNFDDISWPRFWQSDCLVLWCTVMKFRPCQIWPSNMTLTTKFTRLNCILAKFKLYRNKKIFCSYTTI